MTISYLHLSGNIGVGKSNILQRFYRNHFSEQAPTIGVDFQTKGIRILEKDSGRSVNIGVQIWDTSGSERYRSIVVGHYRQAVGALLVFDLTDRSTFECLDFWLQEIRDHARPDCLVILVANKVDLVLKHPENRQVYKQEIQTFIKYNNLLYLGETSAKDNI